MEWPNKIIALIDYPNGGLVKKGEVGVFVEKNSRSGIYDFPSQKDYYVNWETGNYKNYEEINYEIY